MAPLSGANLAAILEKKPCMKLARGTIGCIVLLSLLGPVTILPAQVNFTYHSVYRYLKGKDASGLSADWMTAVFDDGGWAEGNAPFRYGDGTGGVELADMQNGYSTMYLRSHFTCTDTTLIREMTLTVDYDDGFVIWINGVEALRQNAPASLSYDAFAPGNHESGLGESFVVPAGDLNLVEGTNLVAVQGFNVSLTSTDFYFDLAIQAEQSMPVMDDSSGISFSHPSGFYDSPFDLVLTSPLADADIIYTLDGSNPQNSPTAITAGSPCTITVDPESASGRPVTPGFVIRASLTWPGFKPSIPTAATYIFIEKVKAQSYPGGGWPSSNINRQIIDLDMDSKVVDDPQYASLIDDALLDIPTISVVTDLQNLFDPASGIYVNAEGHGLEWEKECSVELIRPDGSEGFNVNAGLRIRGGWSRHPDFPKHAFRLFFREAYGNDKLYFPLFEDEGADQYDKIDLRTAENYAWSNGFENNSFVREVFSRDCQRDMGQPYTRSRYYHLYLNGMYWGLYQTQERSEARYAETYFGGDEEDYDVVKVNMENYVYTVEATDGNLDQWQRLWDLCNTGFASNAGYFGLEGKDAQGDPVPGAEVLVEIDNLIDYMIVIFYTGNFDAPTSSFGQNKGCNNFYAIDNRNDRSSGFTFYNHDAEHSLFYFAHSPGIGIYEDRVNLAERTDGMKMVVYDFQHFHPQWLHHKLCANAEYRSRFADRAYMHLSEGGALSADSVLARVNSRIDEIDLAIIAESARWGDAKTTNPYTRDQHWMQEIDRIRNLFIPERTHVVLDQLRRAGLYRDLDAPFVKVSGEKVLGTTFPLSSAISVSVENPNSKGTIYYTLDGRDPRMVGNGILPEAIQSGGTVTLQIDGSAKLKARISDNDQWSALKEVSFLNQQEDYEMLKVTELHYHPPDWIRGTDTICDTDLEFIEFLNTGEAPINLTGLELDSAVSYRFPESSQLLPDQYYVVASKPAAFFDFYGLIASGNYTGHFSNAGEEVLLVDMSGDPVIHFTYMDGAPWPLGADGRGLSLSSVENYPTGDPADYTYWTLSYKEGGTPFAPNYALRIEPYPAATEEGLVAYPNPTRDMVTLHLKPVPEASRLHITVFDATGFMVYRGTVDNNGRVSLSSLGVRKGLCLIRVESDGITAVARIVVL
jgi:hypothetical protein